jgi:hypothetical protein
MVGGKSINELPPTASGFTLQTTTQTTNLHQKPHAILQQMSRMTSKFPMANAHVPARHPFTIVVLRLSTSEKHWKRSDQIPS